MTINITSRHFRAHSSIHSYAEEAVTQFSKFYDGIVTADVILSFERARKSVKRAEVNLGVHGATLSAKASSSDFQTSIDRATAKVLAQLKKYKERTHAKDRKRVRTLRENG